MSSGETYLSVRLEPLPAFGDRGGGLVVVQDLSEGPRIESDDATMVVGSARPMEDAARIANTELVLWLEAEYGYDRLDAYQLLTQAGGLYVGNMVDTTYSLVASVEKRYLKRS